MGRRRWIKIQKALMRKNRFNEERKKGGRINKKQQEEGCDENPVGSQGQHERKRGGEWGVVWQEVK